MTRPQHLAAIARSWLLVNGTRVDTFEQAHRSPADQIVLDIEDAVDPKRKPHARESVATWLEDHSAWVRINDHTTPYWSDDVDRLAGLPGLAGIMLAKTEAADHVTDTFDRLGGTVPVLAPSDLPGPIDGPTVGNSHTALREQSAVAVSLGLTGKLCLDTGQLPVINEAISPAPSDVIWAREFLADFDARGRVIRDGSDLPQLGRAEKIAHLADAFAICPA